MKTKPFIGNTKFLDSEITGNCVRVCKDTLFSAETQTIYWKHPYHRDLTLLALMVLLFHFSSPPPTPQKWGFILL